MIFKEEKRNLFEVPDEYALAHCISLDCEMGAGIAVEFQKRFNLRNVVRVRSNGVIGECVTYANFDNNNRLVVFNLMTKKLYWHKPTYESLGKTLISMREECQRLDIKNVAMPKIGCGLDRLQWGKVREMIQDTFKDMDIEILVCKL